MLCILCISASDQLIEIFNEDSRDLDACNVISKHFWLKPNAEDPNAKAICRPCWNAVDSFHRFFQMIEEAHTKLNAANFFGLDNASDDDNSLAFPDILVTEYDIKPEPIADTKLNVELHKSEHSELGLDSEAPIFGQKACEKPKSSSSPLPPANVKVKSEECEAEDSIEKKNLSATDTKLKIPSTKRSTKKSSKPTKGINRTGIDGKKYEKKKVPCQKFDEVIRENMELSCTICKESLPSFYALKNHYQSVHNENGFVMCCEKKFESRHSLVQHILLHIDAEYFKCNVCGRVFDYEKGLKVHLKRHMNKDQTYDCEKCNKSFFRKEKLESHIKTHAKREQICEQCGKVTQSLKQHQLNAHSEIPRERVQCPKCFTYLADNSTLKRQMKNLHPEAKTLNVCDICGKISSSENGLRRHILYMHKAERRHKCPMCEKAFKAPQVLRVSYFCSYLDTCSVLGNVYFGYSSND